MKITIEIQCDNAAFDPESAVEVSRILGELSNRVGVNGITRRTLRDINGNSVGTMKVEYDE